MKNIIFIAAPAAGKGTQSKLLKERYGYEHISTGDLLREEISSGSELGITVKNIMAQGLLVSDEIIINLIKQKLESIKGNPFILDGFPRTLNQAKELDNLDIDYEVIYLDLDESEVVNRMNGRLVCQCGMSYNEYITELKPKVNGVCDSCGKAIYKREDDNIDSFKNRYKVFVENSKDILKYYEEKNKLHTINAIGSVLEILQKVVEVVND